MVSTQITWRLAVNLFHSSDKSLGGEMMRHIFSAKIQLDYFCFVEKKHYFWTIGQAFVSIYLPFLLYNKSKICFLGKYYY